MGAFRHMQPYLGLYNFFNFIFHLDSSLRNFKKVTDNLAIPYIPTSVSVYSRGAQRRDPQAYAPATKGDVLGVWTPSHKALSSRFRGNLIFFSFLTI